MLDIDRGHDGTECFVFYIEVVVMVVVVGVLLGAENYL